jgi:regulator of Ty1 transposition protein 103
MFHLDRESAEKLAKVVESACVLLADYNGRLSAELDDRTAVCKMVRAYLSSQKKKVSDCDQRIEVCTWILQYYFVLKNIWQF